MKNSILIVGSNPSQSSPDNSAFNKSTKSYKTIMSWFSDLNNIELNFANLVDEKTDNNKQLSKSKIRQNIDSIIQKTNGYNTIIACGKVASMGLRMAEVDHFEMPHPSGLNRFWNSKEQSDLKIKEMLKYIYESQR